MRLIVRRVKTTPGSQLALFATYSYHGFITDRDGETLELEAGHRRHAEIENAIRGLSQLVQEHLDLGDAPGRANTGDKIMTLVASALAGGDCIDDADALRIGRPTTYAPVGEQYRDPLL